MFAWNIFRRHGIIFLREARWICDRVFRSVLLHKRNLSCNFKIVNWTGKSLYGSQFLFVIIRGSMRSKHLLSVLTLLCWKVAPLCFERPPKLSVEIQHDRLHSSCRDAITIYNLWKALEVNVWATSKPTASLKPEEVWPTRHKVLPYINISFHFTTFRNACVTLTALKKLSKSSENAFGH